MLLDPLTGESTIDSTTGEPIASIIFTVEALGWVEHNLPARSVMEILEHGRQAHWRVTELQILVWAGMEAHRRRTGAGGAQINPASALQVIEKGGGLHPVAMLVMDSLMRSTALGLNPDRNRPEPDARPTTAGASSDDSAAPVFTHQPPVT